METEKEVMTVEELNALTAQITEIHRKMNYLTTLTPEQREKRKKKVGEKALHLLPNRVEAARQNRKLLPSAFDLSKLEADAALTAALSGLLTAPTRIRSNVYDTFVTVGNLAVVGAASANTYIKVASTTAQRLKPIEDQRKSRSSVPTAAPDVIPGPAQRAGPAVTVNLPAEPTTKAA